MLMEMTLENLLSEGSSITPIFWRAWIFSARSAAPSWSRSSANIFGSPLICRATPIEMIGLVMGVPSLMEIFDEKYYLNLEGGILEALGRMFKSGLKLYVYPMIDEKTGEIRDGNEARGRAQSCARSFRYLIDNEFIQEITDYNPEYLRIHPPDALAKLQSGDPAWETNGSARSRRDYQGTASSSVIGRRLPPELGLVAAFATRIRGMRGQKTALSARFPLHGMATNMARRGNSVFGIDLGKHVFKGVLLQRKGDNRFVLTSYASREVPEELTTAEELAQSSSSC